MGRTGFSWLRIGLVGWLVGWLVSYSFLFHLQTAKFKLFLFRTNKLAHYRISHSNTSRNRTGFFDEPKFGGTELASCTCSVQVTRDDICLPTLYQLHRPNGVEWYDEVERSGRGPD
jgi:hypothetical protein